MDKFNDVMKQAEDAINTNEAKRAAISVLELIPSVVEITKKVYDEMISQGFDNKQAYQFACNYTLRCCCGNTN